MQEIQQRLTALGFDTGGTDGRVGNHTMLAIRNFQRKVGMEPADGYAGLKLLAGCVRTSDPVPTLLAGGSGESAHWGSEDANR